MAVRIILRRNEMIKSSRICVCMFKSLKRDEEICLQSLPISNTKTFNICSWCSRDGTIVENTYVMNSGNAAQ